MLIIEVQGNQVQFDVEQIIERIDGIENCLQLVLMEMLPPQLLPERLLLMALTDLKVQ